MHLDCTGNSFRWPDTVIRRVWRHEQDHLTSHLLRLRDRDRYKRFNGYLNDDQIIAYIQGKDWRKFYAMGAWLDGRLRGAAELELRSEQWPRAAEVALSVDPEIRRRGIGHTLFRRLLLLARNRFVSQLYLTTQRDNVGVLRIARRSGVRLIPDNGHMTSVNSLALPNSFTILEEAFGESCSRMADVAEIYDTVFSTFLKSPAC